ncbi:MAG TPA: PaaI family thioesterase [Caulobacteraceae bacterium]|nr:PaaI family thioesterase [Caulobacteraceae bacterium]
MDGGDAQTPWPRELITDGEWAGWTIWSSDPFELHAGPFYTKRDETGVVCAFKAERKHMNGGGFMHGGCLMTFADYAIFAIAGDALDGTGSVTASMNSEFIDGAREGELIEARGEVVRNGGSLVFLRGQVSTGGRTLLNFSAIIKKVRRKG